MPAPPCLQDPCLLSFGWAGTGLHPTNIQLAWPMVLQARWMPCPECPQERAQSCRQRKPLGLCRSVLRCDLQQPAWEGISPSARRRHFIFIFIFLFMIVTERERGRDIGRGRSRLHAPGARRGIRSQVSRIAPWAKGRRQTAAPPRDPQRRRHFNGGLNLWVRQVDPEGSPHRAPTARLEAAFPRSGVPVALPPPPCPPRHWVTFASWPLTRPLSQSPALIASGSNPIVSLVYS